MTRRHLAFLLVATFSAAGCGSHNNSVLPGDGGGGGGGGGGNGGGGGGGGGGGMLPSGTQLGTYIVLGDSISDKGGVAPFFYDQLKTDLTAKYPNLMYVHAAQGGAITDDYSDNKPSPGTRPLVKTQIAGLANNYPGDVLVTITVGGNDLVAHATEAIAGSDSSVRSELAAHLDAELGELTMPGRLGSGKVYIVLANIYDFSDGMGDFFTLGCPPYANVNAMKDAAGFAAWNGVMSDAAQKAKATLYDMHGDFQGHGLNYKTSNPDLVWYNTDCIHPNAKGHDAIRRSIYKMVTGQALP